MITTEQMLQETLDMIKSGIPAVHICGDDYAQVDRFITQIAEDLGYEILEWNFGYGLVDDDIFRRTLN